MVDKKGNFGSISDPSPAAMRYTECRMAAAAVDMVADINEDTVDQQQNYDNTTTEPVVLPSRFPNLICNGSQGIAVGMATSIPPHNLNEVCDALTALVENPQLEDRELVKIIPGPDFPTGGLICGVAGVHKAYATGRGSLALRGKVEITTKKDKAFIAIRELPYQVTTEVIKQMRAVGFKVKRGTHFNDRRETFVLEYGVVSEHSRDLYRLTVESWWHEEEPDRARMMWESRR